jgi:hypothetical protein
MGLLSKKEQWHCERTMEKKFVKKVKKVVTVIGCKLRANKQIGRCTSKATGLVTIHKKKDADVIP